MGTSKRIVVPYWLASRFAHGAALVRAGHGGAGLRPKTVTEARSIARTLSMTPEKFRRMRAWLHRHGVPSKESVARRTNPLSPAAVAWWLWGGDPSIPYARTRWQDPVGAWIERTQRAIAREQKVVALRRPSRSR